MGRAKKISKAEYYFGWAAAGFPKRLPKTKAFVSKKKKKGKRK